PISLTGLPDAFNPNKRRFVQWLEQTEQTRMGVGRNMGNPNPVPLRTKLQRGLLFLVVPFHRREMFPMFVVVAEDRDGIGVHRTSARLVVVLAHEVRQRKSDLAGPPA